MTLQQVIDQARDMGCVATSSIHESGRTVQFERLGVERGPMRIRVSFQWDEEDQFVRILSDWLATLPWPSEDDPRVAGQY